MLTIEYYNNISKSLYEGRRGVFRTGVLEFFIYTVLAYWKPIIFRTPYYTKFWKIFIFRTAAKLLPVPAPWNPPPHPLPISYLYDYESFNIKD